MTKCIKEVYGDLTVELTNGNKIEAKVFRVWNDGTIVVIQKGKKLEEFEKYEKQEVKSVVKHLTKWTNED